ncbi:hypothetical protein BC833DRAFT_617920 [Globomyces pollinis-pini]|nr:hypothetical protein BC833DRAFT_617920 [Globomyces pollinis-pini]
MFTQLIVSALVATVSAQNQDCSLTNFQPCLKVMEEYKIATCGHLHKHLNYFNECLCYQQVYVGQCYSQCPGNAEVQTKFQKVQVPKIMQTCNAAGLNPTNLTFPASYANTGIDDGPYPGWTVSGAYNAVPATIIGTVAVIAALL